MIALLTGPVTSQTSWIFFSKQRPTPTEIMGETCRLENGRGEKVENATNKKAKIKTELTGKPGRNSVEYD